MWSAYLFQTTTGVVGPKVQFESLSWSMELNGIESIQLSVRKSELPQVDLSFWFAAWWAGVVLLWNDSPVVAGPIITRPKETIDDITISCGGIRSLLANRVVVEEQTDWSKIQKSELSYNNVSLGTIAQRVVKDAMKKPGGSLPIGFPQPEETSALNNADHERNFKGFNIQNLYCDSILTRLSDVINGPDIMFKPALIRDNQLMFQMYHGTEKQPRIAQDFVKIWDTTPEKGQVADIDVNYSGSYQASRVFSIGAGQDEGVLISVSTNNTPIQKNFPLLEKVINTSNSENIAVVRSHGDSHLAANEDAIPEIQMTVEADGEIPIGSFWPGDMAYIITKDFIAFPSGVTPMRILHISGNHTNKVRVSLQKDENV